MFSICDRYLVKFEGFIVNYELRRRCFFFLKSLDFRWEDRKLLSKEIRKNYNFEEC